MGSKGGKDFLYSSSNFYTPPLEWLLYNQHLIYFLQDTSESLIVVGRYISENYNGVALHPIDFIDVSTGQLVAEVMDPNITTISPVNKLHPRDDVLASGSSRFVYINLFCVVYMIIFLCYGDIMNLSFFFNLQYF